MHDRTSRAAKFFDAERNYRGRAIAVTRMRAEVVRSLLGELQGKRIVDLGSGDGQISAPFVRNNDVTWVDVSSGMLAAAVEALDEADRSRLRVVNQDVLGFKADAPYDVVIALGILAHVTDARAFLIHVRSLLRPGGVAVLQYSDHDSPFLVPDRYWLKLMERLRPRYGYLPNETSGSDVNAWAQEAGLRALRTTRFVMPPPGIRRLLPPALAYGYAKLSARLPWRELYPEVLVLFENASG
jgi:cyclopropane fatty-acyl-phospholipid synthase-like methyltransferase